MDFKLIFDDIWNFKSFFSELLRGVFVQTMDKLNAFFGMPSNRCNKIPKSQSN